MFAPVSSTRLWFVVRYRLLTSSLRLATHRLAHFDEIFFLNLVNLNFLSSYFWGHWNYSDHINTQQVFECAMGIGDAVVSVSDQIKAAGHRRFCRKHRRVEGLKGCYI